MKKRVSLSVMIVFALIIAAGFAFNLLLVTELLPKTKTYEVPLDPNAKNPTVFTSVSVSKSWVEDRFHMGAEYDWTLYNTGNDDIDSWTVTMTVPDKMEIDSYWNMDSYELEGNTLTIHPDEFVDLCFAKEKRTFGMIIISMGTVSPVSFSDIVIQCHPIYQYTSTPLFYVLLLVSLIWVVILVAILAQNRVRKQMERRLVRDRQVILQSMSVFVNFIDAKDAYTNGHSQRVAEYSAEIGRRFGLSSDDVDNLYYAALLHDSGKIGIPDSILKKKGKLDHDEFEVIKTHSTIGGEMLEGFTAIKNIPEVAKYHHEKYDGTGYPEGLSGNDIPLFARIVCVADSYDAMSSNRCYRDSLPEDVIRAEFERCTGTQFDPMLVPYILKMMDDGTTERIANDFS